MSDRTILSVENLQMGFDVRRGGKRVRVQAVDDVSLSLAEGEVLGIVGESGCGKTTVGRSIMRLAEPQGGKVLFRGNNILAENGKNLDELRLDIRMVFQDPYASLNPRRTIADSIAEAGDINGKFKDRADRDQQIAASLSAVGLDQSFAGRYPHELSGGQRQRVGIARAILPVPAIVIADEPVSALDVSIQAQVLNLLMDLRETLKLSMIFISHDIGVIGYVSHRLVVMYRGRVVETGETKGILEHPAHPYTRALLAAVPRPDPSLRIAGTIPVGEPPSQFSKLVGCPYASRCPLVSQRCRAETPQLRPLKTDGPLIACHNV